MHQKKFEFQIGKEGRGLSPDSGRSLPIFFPSIHQKHLQFQTQSQSTHQNTNYTPSQPLSQLRIHIPPLSTFRNPSQFPSTPSTTPTHQTKTQFENEPLVKNALTRSNLLSTSQKRPIMSQAPSTLSHSPTLQYLQNHSTSVSKSGSFQPSCLCSSSFPIVLATKTIALKIIRYSCRSRWIQVHLRFFFLLSLPCLYFFTSYNHQSFFLNLLSVLAFSAVFVISLNVALPRLPSIRLLLARSFPIKLSSSTTSSKPHPPVVWSIGSKPKSKTRPNSGSWVQVYSNGDVYEGEFHKGNCSGSGVYYYHMSGKYEGDWVDEKYDGHGIETWAKGSRYRGQYRQGLRHGFGVYRFYTGDVYAGEWCNGQCHGCGVHTCEDGSSYAGEFKWGVKHGLGCYHFRNGDAYTGEYFADRMHGFGVYRFANGHRYEGAWHEGRRQGLGIYTFRNGETQSGHWQNGVLNVSSTQESVTGSPAVIVSHSRVLNAVKEAQQAAEKAIHVPKVDGRVNKAVVAANKAANAARVAAVKAVQNQMHQNTHDNAPTSFV